mmetsp:Transcript_31087/g.45494  ORF Transcript_31087/g.45494 Transcript_31087/m.45494 type:complete len:315 (+) Transcript_31087:124-1068(+)
MKSKKIMNNKLPNIPFFSLLIHIVFPAFILYRYPSFATATITSEGFCYPRLQQRSHPFHDCKHLKINRIKIRHSSNDDQCTSRRNENIGDGESNGFIIREGKVTDLLTVAQVIEESFYENDNDDQRKKDVFNEFDRLRYNFPRQQTAAATNLQQKQRKHLFIVACSPTDQSDIFGFCEIDGRMMTNPYRADVQPPRPYLSDLSVRKDCRRKGIAKSIIEYCEMMVQKMGHDCLHLRVERMNTAALQMYSGLNYEVVPHAVFGVKDTTLLLKRKFSSNDHNSNCDRNGEKMVGSTLNKSDHGSKEDALYALDYQV